MVVFRMGRRRAGEAQDVARGLLVAALTLGVVFEGCATIDTPLAGGGRVIESRNQTVRRVQGAVEVSTAIHGSELEVHVARADTCIDQLQLSGYYERRVAHQLTGDAASLRSTFMTTMLVGGAITAVVGILFVTGRSASDGMEAIEPNPPLGWALVGGGVGAGVLGLLPLLRPTQWQSVEREPFTDTSSLPVRPCAANAVRAPVQLVIGGANYDFTTGEGGRLRVNLEEPRYQRDLAVDGHVDVSIRGAAHRILSASDVVDQSATRMFRNAQQEDSTAGWQRFLSIYPQYPELADSARRRVAALEARAQRDVEWRSIVERPDPVRLQNFIANHPADARAAEARRMLAALEAHQAVPEDSQSADSTADRGVTAAAPTPSTATYDAETRASRDLMTLVNQCRSSATAARSNRDQSALLHAIALCDDALDLMAQNGTPRRAPIHRAVRALRTSLIQQRRLASREGRQPQAPRHTPTPPMLTPQGAQGLLDEARGLIDRCGTSQNATQRSRLADAGIERVRQAINAGADRDTADAIRRRLERCR